MKPLSNPRSSDADYLAAVKAGDMEMAQRMVDEAAKKAATTPEQLMELSASRNLRRAIDGTSMVEIRLGKPTVVKVGEFMAEAKKYGLSLGEKYNHLGVITNYHEVTGLLREIGLRVLPKYNKALKTKTKIGPLADPITRDDQGNVIPLSQRFNPNKNSIRNPMKPLMMNPKRGTYAGGTGYWRKSMGADEQKPASPKPQGENSRESMYVEYLHPLPGENRFTMGGTDFVYVWAKYPDGRRDIGVYAFSGDVTYGYGWFRTYYNLDGQRRTQDAMQPAARAKLNRMDAAIK